LKTQPKPVLGSLPLAFALPVQMLTNACLQLHKVIKNIKFLEVVDYGDINFKQTCNDATKIS
jgi:hypothetical protein